MKKHLYRGILLKTVAIFTTEETLGKLSSSIRSVDMTNSWTPAESPSKLTMDDCKAYNGRLQSLQWTIARISMDDGKDYFTQERNLRFPVGLLS